MLFMAKMVDFIIALHAVWSILTVVLDQSEENIFAAKLQM